MDAKKEKLLSDTYKIFLESLFQEIANYDILDNIICKDVIGFGTAIDEKVDSLFEYKKMLRFQLDQINEMEISTKFIPFKQTISPTNNTAVIAEDIYLTVVIATEQLEIYIRLSVVLEYRAEKWVIITFHGSKPEYVNNDVDTFGIEEWKQKNEDLERLVAEKTADLNAKLEELKSTQAQLIQSEKMASLGELTAGIAHEIQNPLNFVNNFSEITQELLEELEEDIAKGYQDRDLALQNELIKDIKSNLSKINHHGKRADGIVKSMLQHSRATSNKKELTDINALADEYLRLAFHGLRAKDKTFNSKIETSFDDSIGKVSLVAQDIGRVILNLLTNAFYAVNEKKEMLGTNIESDKGISNYEPTVWLNTIKEDKSIIITVKDNGMGIPSHVKAKIFQPFFTTKPTGKGTGLGLSMSYDIITKGNKGQLLVDSVDGESTTFTVILPIEEQIN